MQPDTFGAYVRAELEYWGRVFALHRDAEPLGFQSKNQLQVLIEHRGEMPAPNIGYKPLHIDSRAQLIEDLVADIARSDLTLAVVLRAYYCGSGRRKEERWEQANAMLQKKGEKSVSVRHYQTLVELGFQRVRGQLEGLSRAA